MIDAWTLAMACIQAVTFVFLALAAVNAVKTQRILNQRMQGCVGKAASCPMSGCPRCYVPFGTEAGRDD